MKKILSIIIILAILVTSLSLVACNDEKPDSYHYYDKITQTLKLSKSYEGKSFMEDGIGLATVEMYTDGDTTRFRTGESSVIIRYFCADAPESTGGSDKWGKSASNFVKQQLSQATEIVLESSTGGRPVTDNYNVRYLGYVWYKSAGSKDFKLLNLELMENGYSLNESATPSATPYYAKFEEAEDFAKKNGLRIHGDDDDPLYSTDPIDITLNEFWDNIDLYYNEETDSGAKVRFDVYLDSLYISPTLTHMFTGYTYDKETGRKSKPINIYCAYASNSASKLKIGNLYKVIGTIQKYNGSFQVSGIYYNSIREENMEDGTLTVQRDYYLTFDSSVEYIDQYSRTLFSDATVKSSKVENGVLTIVAEASQVKNDEKSEFTFTVNVSDGFQNNFTEGKIFSVRGYQFVENSHNIFIPSISGILIK